MKSLPRGDRMNLDQVDALVSLLRKLNVSPYEIEALGRNASRVMLAESRGHPNGLAVALELESLFSRYYKAMQSDLCDHPDVKAIWQRINELAPDDPAIIRCDMDRRMREFRRG